MIGKSKDMRDFEKKKFKDRAQSKFKLSKSSKYPKSFRGTRRNSKRIPPLIIELPNHPCTTQILHNFDTLKFPNSRLNER